MNGALHGHSVFLLDAIWKTKISRILTTEMLKYENPGWETVLKTEDE